MTRSPADASSPARALTFANVADGAEGLVLADLARAVAAKPKAPAISLRWSAATARAWQQLARALAFFAPDLAVHANSRPGTASPMTACRRMPASWRSA